MLLDDSRAELVADAVLARTARAHGPRHLLRGVFGVGGDGRSRGGPSDGFVPRVGGRFVVVRFVIVFLDDRLLRHDARLLFLGFGRTGHGSPLLLDLLLGLLLLLLLSLLLSLHLFVVVLVIFVQELVGVANRLGRVAHAAAGLDDDLDAAVVVLRGGGGGRVVGSHRRDGGVLDRVDDFGGCVRVSGRLL